MFFSFLFILKVIWVFIFGNVWVQWYVKCQLLLLLPIIIIILYFCAEWVVCNCTYTVTYIQFSLTCFEGSQSSLLTLLSPPLPSPLSSLLSPLSSLLSPSAHRTRDCSRRSSGYSSSCRLAEAVPVAPPPDHTSWPGQAPPLLRTRSETGACSGDYTGMSSRGGDDGQGSHFPTFFR